jgi:hypothetical protein
MDLGNVDVRIHGIETGDAFVIYAPAKATAAHSRQCVIITLDTLGAETIASF